MIELNRLGTRSMRVAGVAGLVGVVGATLSTSVSAQADGLFFGDDPLGESVATIPLLSDPNPSPNIVWSSLGSNAGGTGITNVGSVTSEGDAVMNANNARTTFGVNGTGIKIGLISDSFVNNGANTGLANGQITAGDLPGATNPNGFLNPVTVVKDSTGSDEGRAMFEIVHDVAPGAQLFFHSAFNNPGTIAQPPDQTIANAINGLVAQNVDIIVDDVGILTASRFQDGAAAQAVDAAKAAGIAYFSSAGNSGTEATRQAFNGGVGGLQDFDLNTSEGGDNFLNVSVNPNTRLSLQWDDPYATVGGGGAAADYAIVLSDGTSIVATFDANGIGDDPFEFIGFTGSGTALVGIQHVSGDTARNVQLSVFGGSIADDDDTNTATIFGHAAADGAVAAAAIFHAEPGLDDVEGFSSRGLVDILFDTAGNPVVVQRNKPDLTGPDGVTTTTAGFSSFFGTSAAAPHLAAAAALVLQAANEASISLTVDQLYSALFSTAIDIEAPGFDIDSGFGRIDVLAAINSVVPEPSVAVLLLSVGGVLLGRRRAA